MADKQKTNENVSATWVVSNELRQMITQHAKIEDRSESSLVRQILREHLSPIGPFQIEVKAPLPADIIYQLINSAIQSGKPLFLSGANLQGSTLSGADLTKANLSQANLNGADLSGAKLEEANLRQANLIGTNLNGADLADADLHDSTYSSSTIWPEGFDHEADGAVACESYVESVANAITTQLGYKVDIYVKSKGLWAPTVDLGIIEPRNPGVYILGIMCDQERYYSADQRYLLEKQRLIHKSLEQVGWRIWRIWSLDWYRDPTHVIELLKAALLNT